MSNSIRLAVLLSLITLLAGAAMADAAPLTAGNEIHVLDGPGNTGGGEFTIVVDSTTSFVSFCLQMTEYINFTSAFKVDAISTFAVSDPVLNGGDPLDLYRDPLSDQTAFLYTQFRAGTLTDYSYSGFNHQASANSLQKAIWMFEEELPMVASNPFVMLANSAMGTWSGLGNVRVMNLSRNGQEAQDQLMLVPGRDITEVPEPASLILFGSGVSLAGMARRRQRRSAKNT
jgi:hypothetical protein